MEILFRKLFGRFRKSKPITPATFHRIRDIYRARNCSCCVYQRAAVNWWCFNKQASETGCSNCSYWRPDRCFIRETLKDEIRRGLLK